MNNNDLTNRKYGDRYGSEPASNETGQCAVSDCDRPGDYEMADGDYVCEHCHDDHMAEIEHTLEQRDDD